MVNQKIQPHAFSFSGKIVNAWFGAGFSLVDELLLNQNVIFITDSNIFQLHPEKFAKRKVIVIKAGEKNKTQQTVDRIIAELIEMQADRNTFIVGVGGGVITDMAGYVASVYLRGIKFGFVPTSILAMVDAAIGGKNGVDVGVYKNLVGVINQPQFLLYDFSFLKTLPDDEWKSGFAEIIKHACIKDSEMFQYLEQHSIKYFQENEKAIAALVEKNVTIKYNVVASDENETGERRLLNFGHTIGHAIENVNSLLHGFAISLGMTDACKISEKINGLSNGETEKVKKILVQYGLPVSIDTDKQKTWEILLHDKKKSGTEMNFVVLDKIGKGAVKKIPLTQLQTTYTQLT